MSNPLITFLFPCKLLETSKNVLEELFSSFLYHSAEIKDQVEFIIKIDNGDYLTFSEITRIKEARPELNIKTIQFGEWENRNSIHLFYQYLVFFINPNTRFVGFISDDLQFYRDMNFILAKYKTDPKYFILYTPEHFYPPREHYTTEKELNNALWTENYPIVSVELLKLVNLGVIINIDSYFSLLNMILIQNHGIDLKQPIEGWARRHGENIFRKDDSSFGFNANSIKTIPSIALNILEENAKSIAYRMK